MREVVWSAQTSQVFMTDFILWLKSIEAYEPSIHTTSQGQVEVRVKAQDVEAVRKILGLVKET